MQKEKRIGILGIGNMLLSDEGFGVHFVQHLEAHYLLPDNVQVFDGGTAGILLAPFVEQCDHLFVIDVVNIDDAPGSLHCFSDEEVRAGDIQTRMSPHQIGMLEVLDICKIMGKVPEQIMFLTVVPENMDAGMKLSPILQQRIGDVLSLLSHSLQSLGVSLVAGTPAGEGCQAGLAVV